MIGAGRALTLAAMVLLAAALCAVIGFEIVGRAAEQDRQVPARVAEPTQRSAIDVAESPNQRAGWFKEVVSRPLFSPDRRPVGPEAREVRGLPRLAGIVMDGPRKVAIFVNPSGGRPTVVEVGSRVGAYEVRNIADTGVTVIGPEGATTIRPIFDTAPAAAKPPLAVRPESPKVTGR